MAALSTLTDDFAGASRNTAKWDQSSMKDPSNAGPTVGQGSGFLAITPQVGDTGYDGYLSDVSYDATGSGAFVRVLQVAGPSGSGSLADTSLCVGKAQPLVIFSDTVYAEMLEEGGTLWCMLNYVSGGTMQYAVIADLPYSATSHAWWRLRHRSSDDMWLWETAPSSASDPPQESDWTVRASTSCWWELGNEWASLEAGTYQSESSLQSAQFDGFNTATSAGATTHSGAVAETLALTDAAAGRLVAAGAVAETVTLTDAPAASVARSAALAETLTLSDAFGGTVGAAPVEHAGAVAETLTLADALDAAVVAGPAQHAGALAEALDLADAFDAIVVAAPPFVPPSWLNRVPPNAADGAWAASSKLEPEDIEGDLADRFGPD